MTTQLTDTLGLLTYQISRETFGRQTDQILRAAYKQKYQIVISIAPNRTSRDPLDDQTRQIKQLLSQGIGGLLIHTRGDKRESDHIVNTVQGRVPVVTFHRPTPNLNGVVLDDAASFCEATNHLIRLGHERIGFVGPEWNGAIPVLAKAKGYSLAMQKHGLVREFPPALGIYAKGGYLQGKTLGDQFTALVCRDDYTAIGVCRGLREVGIRVPEDVAVVGNGDLGVAEHMTPALTTLATPYEAIAQAALELMLEQLAGGPGSARQVTLQAPLVVRESCGATNACCPK